MEREVTERQKKETAKQEHRESQKLSEHVVQAKETLYSIARSYYGDNKYANAIFELNKKIIGDDPNRLREGMVIFLPSKGQLDQGLVVPRKEVGRPDPTNVASGKDRTATVELANKVALSFDDGPSLEFTPQILEILKKHGIKATFFVTGENIKGREEMIRSIVREGHVIGNHGYEHVHFTEQNKAELDRNIQHTQQEVDRALGKHYEIKVVRPPGGIHNSSVDTEVRQLGDKLTTWNVNSMDWECEKNPEQIIKNVLNHRPTIAVEGGNVLLHERVQTVKVLDRLLTELEKEKYQFVFTEKFCK